MNTTESFEGRVLRAVRNWTLDTPECYAQRSDEERFFYSLWVSLKIKIEQAAMGTPAGSKEQK